MAVLSRAKHYKHSTTPSHAPSLSFRDIVSRPARILPHTRHRTRTRGRHRLVSLSSNRSRLVMAVSHGTEPACFVLSPRIRAMCRPFTRAAVSACMALTRFQTPSLLEVFAPEVVIAGSWSAFCGNVSTIVSKYVRLMRRRLRHSWTRH